MVTTYSKRTVGSPSVSRARNLSSGVFVNSQRYGRHSLKAHFWHAIGQQGAER